MPAKLTWTAASKTGTTVSAYRPREAGVVLGTLGPAVLTFTDDSATTGTAYDVIADFADGTSVTSAAVTYTSAPTVAMSGGPSNGTWSLAFSDDFTGTSVDTTKWVVINGQTQNNTTNVPANVAVADSELKLTLASTTSGGQIASHAWGNQAAPSNGYLFPVGAYAEARCWFPGNGTGHYNWPAWWSSGPNWPTNGEIDIAEVLGGPLTSNYHYGTSVATRLTKQAVNHPYYLGDGWHVFGAHRKATAIDYYLDGELVGSVTTDDLGGGHPLTLNIGHEPAGPTLTGAAAAFRVDWVRSWHGSGVPPAKAKVSTLVDAFTTGIDLTRWHRSGGITHVNGRAEWTVGPANVYLTISSVSRFDITASGVYAKVGAIPATTGYQQTFQIRKDATNYAEYRLDGGWLYGEVYVNGASAASGAGSTYNATTHAYWRIVQSGTGFDFSTSPDGLTWTARGSVACSWASTATSVLVQMTAGSYNALANATVSFDNVNTTG